jgi:hypothetical protein
MRNSGSRLLEEPNGYGRFSEIELSYSTHTATACSVSILYRLGGDGHINA